jgi:hypothetical protein
VNATPAANPKPTHRGRLVLLLVALLFFGPILIAGVLGRLGVHPSASANKGEALQPYVDWRAAQLHRVDGSVYAWQPEARLWRIAVLPNATQCAGEKAAACAKLAADIAKVRLLAGDDARRVQVLWMGALPSAATPAFVPLQGDAALRAQLPRVDAGAGASAYLIDPNGFVVMRYAPGFAPRDLHDDLARLLKLM